MADEQLLAERPTEKTDLSDYLREPFQRLRSEVDRLLDDFPPRFPAPAFSIRQLASMPMPALEMTELEKEYHLSVEVPGVPAKDVEISIEGDLLVLKGEKKEAHEQTERNYCISERSYGSFERRVTLPPDAIADDISASSENGVLTVVIPRTERSRQESRKVEIKDRTKA